MPASNTTTSSGKLSHPVIGEVLVDVLADIRPMVLVGDPILCRMPPGGAFGSPLS